MPSVSPNQAHLMAAVAHGWKKPGGGGPSQALAKEWHAADKHVGKYESYAQSSDHANTKHGEGHFGPNQAPGK